MPLIFFEHYFRGFDYGGHRVTDFQFHFVRAALGNHAFDEIIADADDDVRHYAAEFQFLDFSGQFITSRKCHEFMSPYGDSLLCQLYSLTAWAAHPKLGGKRHEGEDSTDQYLGETSMLRLGS